MTKSNWKPRGYNSVSPYLLTAQPDKVCAFFEKVFGAKVKHRITDDDDRVMHAEVKLDDSIIMMGDPGDGSTSLCHIHVYVKNVDAIYKKAIKAGGKSVQKPVQKGDSDKRGGVTDPSKSVTVWIGTKKD